MVAASPLDAQPQRGDFRAIDIHAGRTGQPRGGNAVRGQEVDHRLLDAPHQLAHLKIAAAQVEQQISHHLAGAVIGNLPAAVNLHDRDTDVIEQVLRLARKACASPQGWARNQRNQAGVRSQHDLDHRVRAEFAVERIQLRLRGGTHGAGE